MAFLLWLLLTISRPYHPETIDSLHASLHTHVEVAGLVTLVKREADGDVHFRISDPHAHFIVCEIIPQMTMAAPHKGDRVTVRGIHRYDNERGHGWDEIHPVESWTVQ